MAYYWQEYGCLLKGNTLGNPIHMNEAEKYIFGFIILSDWSARDIQQQEAILLAFWAYSMPKHLPRP